ncbi:MAG: hypothetical protein AAGG00_15165, partial [Cyanobacteria bacterium P01_H01_bin.150]
SKGQLKQIRARLKALEQQKNAELLQIQRVIAASEAELAQAKRSFEDKKIVSTAEVQEAKAQFNLAKNEVESYRLLVGNGAISKLKLAEKEAALRTARARLRKLKVGLNPNNAEVMVAQAKIGQVASLQFKIQNMSLRDTLSLTTHFVNANKIQNLNQWGLELQGKRISNPIDNKLLRYPVWL